MKRRSEDTPKAVALLEITEENFLNLLVVRGAPAPRGAVAAPATPAGSIARTSMRACRARDPGSGENPPKNPGRGAMPFSVQSNGTYVQFRMSAVVGSTLYARLGVSIQYRLTHSDAGFKDAERHWLKKEGVFSGFFPQFLSASACRSSPYRRGTALWLF
jgi:hypothetical protein